MTTVAELLIEALAEHGVTQVWGVVGDALNPVTDAIRREDRIEWVGVRHEEAAAFAACAQAQLTDRLGVCMGTVGPGAIHLLNGLYDAKKSHAPVLAICGQVPARGDGQRLLPGGRQRRALRRRGGLQPDRDQRRPAAAADRAGRQRRAARARGGRADPARRRRRASTCRSTRRCRASSARCRGRAPDPDAVQAAAAAPQRGRQGHPARRPGGPGRARRGAPAGRAALGADGADPQGQGGARATTTPSRSGSPG